MNDSILDAAKFSRRILWYLLLGFSLYWLGNILAVFPWLLSKFLGITTMFLSICLWGYMSYYSLRRVPFKDRTKDSLAMAMCFLLTAVVQDYFLYAVYRGIPDELYEFTTFLAYGLVFLIPFLVRYTILRRKTDEPFRAISKKAYIIAGLIGVCSLILTLWSIKLW
jgi:hypothetical protein